MDYLSEFLCSKVHSTKKKKTAELVLQNYNNMFYKEIFIKKLVGKYFKERDKNN